MSGLSYDDLIVIFKVERDQADLQPLPDHFRQNIKAAYERLEIKKRDLKDFDEILKVDDEIRSLKQIVHGINNKRWLKILDAAVLNASGSILGADMIKHASPYEKQAYEVLRAAIRDAMQLIGPGVIP